MDTNYTGIRILAKDIQVSNDTRKTRLNNNDIIIGASGSGKSSGYVVPNIRQYSESMIIADTKGILYGKLHKELRRHGYRVRLLDFVNLDRSGCYNPLDYIGVNRKTGCCREQDVLSIANILITTQLKKDPFWEDSARMVLTSLIAFVKEALPKREQNMVSVANLAKLIYDGTAGEDIFNQLEKENPDSFAVRKFKGYRDLMHAGDRTWACVTQFLSVALKVFDFREAEMLLGGNTTFRMEQLGQKKMALFVNVSDTDRSFDRLLNVFYTQAIQQLCREADANPDGRLKVPVRIILDDFATNVVIPDFDKIISVIRSRELSVSVILQSISQLETLYTRAQAMTILNGCDHMLYLGGQDIDTADYISIKANKPIEHILNMGLDDAYLFERGAKPRKVEKLFEFL